MASLVKREYVVLFQELVGKSYRWPRTIRDMVFAQHHLNNKERLTVIVFLYRNGVNPSVVRGFFLQCYDFDDCAWRQIDYVLRQLDKGVGWKQWNVVLGCSI